MKTRFKPRELTLMFLPIALLGSVALWASRGGSWTLFQSLPADINMGKPRLEVTDIGLVAPKPADVAQGYVWGAKATLWQKGGLPISPKGGQRFITYGHSVANVFYRRDKLWLPAPPLPKEGRFNGPDRVRHVYDAQSEQILGDFSLKKQLVFQANLSGIPRDAREIRVRGRFLSENWYQGSACGAIRPSQSWKVFGTKCHYILSHPFDLSIKAPTAPWPTPIVSHLPSIELVGSHWITWNDRSTLLIHLRGTAGIFPASMSVKRFAIYDGDGKKQEIYYPYNAGEEPEAVQTVMIGLAGVQKTSLPSNERLFDLALKGGPLCGWQRMKAPLHLVAQFSDGSSWPTDVDVKLNLKQGRPTDYGAESNDYY